MSSHPRDCAHTADIASYLLGAHERADEVKAHIALCPICQEELTRLAPTVQTLPISVREQQLPAPVRNRVMEQVKAEAEVLRAAGPSADKVRRPRAVKRTRVLLAVAGTAAVVLAGAVLVTLGSQPVRTTTANVAPAISGARAELRQGAGHAELVVTHMPQAPLGKIYEVWLKRPGRQPQPTDALFSVTNTGNSSVNVPTPLAHVTQVLVTSEPLGGSHHPTGPALLTFDLS